MATPDLSMITPHLSLPTPVAPRPAAQTPNFSGRPTFPVAHFGAFAKRPQLNEASDPYMQCAGYDDPQFTEVADDDSFFDSVNELVLDPKTGQVNKKAMARKKAKREASKERSNDTSKSKSKAFSVLGGQGFPNTTKNS